MKRSRDDDADAQPQRKSRRLDGLRQQELERLRAMGPTDGSWLSANHYTGQEHVSFHNSQFPEVRKGIKNALDQQIAGGQPVAAPALVCGKASQIQGEHPGADPDFVKHVTDDKNRTVLAYGRIRGSKKGGKGTTPDAPNDSRLVGIDDRGHLVAEDAVGDAANPNVTGNIIGENAVINQQYKTPFEEFVKDYAEKNPTDRVHTVHQPIYDGDAVRPSRVHHFIVVNGQVRASLTLENPTDLKFPGR